MKKIIMLFLACFLLQNCNDETAKKEYMPVLSQLHSLECEHLKQEGMQLKYASVEAFRSAAFQAVLKDLNRKVLVEYEGYYQKLAQLEFLMTANEKATYFSDIKKVYADNCK